jgi:hypothetical protein
MARSIQKIPIQALYFFATCSPSFAISAKQYLRLTQHTVSAASRIPSDCMVTTTPSWVEVCEAPAGVLPPPQPPPLLVTHVMFTTTTCHQEPPVRVQSLMEFHFLLDKAQALPTEVEEYCLVPLGPLADPSRLLWPAYPTTPFEFPFHIAEEAYCDFNVLDGLPQPCLMDSVTHVVRLPRVCGLSLDDDLVVPVSRAVTGSDTLDNPSLMDGGANICLTGILDLLVEVVLIAPLPIMVATKTGNISMDDCCTKRDLLLLTLADGLVYFQPCYYCKNVVETIISTQAILAASDVPVQWTQTGHKDGSPGTIRFNSDSGLYSISMTLEIRDVLYYCPMDVFTVDWDPVWCNI